MAQIINEVKRMQFLAGVIKESRLNEEDSSEVKLSSGQIIAIPQGTFKNSETLNGFKRALPFYFSKNKPEAGKEYTVNAPSEPEDNFGSDMAWGSNLYITFKLDQAGDKLQVDPSSIKIKA